MSQNELYETVIGLEVHVELSTETKLFCSCKNAFGAAPNENICPICLGMPGTLPLPNEKACRYAVAAGLALGSEVKEISRFDRKNYRYPDLPKAYQITQFFHPICLGGGLEINTPDGKKRIGITRIHIEEDAGKLIHDSLGRTLIDYGRAGVPLIEIVSEPDIRSAGEAVLYLKKLRLTMLSLGISDCRMNEGSFRADVNVSVRKKGASALGVRTEIKNLNSFAFVAKAIEYESGRQIGLIENGQNIVKETRRFDPDSGKTLPMRTKEDESDYRYFPEPDIPPLTLPRELIEEIRRTLPELPDEKNERLTSVYGLTEADAGIISENGALYAFFLECSAGTEFSKTLANLILSLPAELITEERLKATDPARFGSVVTLYGEGRINSSVAKSLASKLFSEEGKDIVPEEYVKEHGLTMITDPATLTDTVRSAIEENPRAFADLLAGKAAAEKAIMGACMKKTGGKADPVLTRKILLSFKDERKPDRNES